MNDLRFALRAFLRDPRFAAVALLPLALGIGVNAAVIGLVDALLLRPLPGITADGLVWISAVESGSARRSSVAFREIDDLRAGGADVFEEVAAFRNLALNLGEGRTPERIPAQVVTANYFDTLGVRPALGRWFRPQEGLSGARPVAVVSHDFWHRRLGGGTSALARSLTLNGTDFAVVGVAPRDFAGVTMTDRPPQVWLTAAAASAFPSEREMTASRQAPVFEALGRLRPGVSIAAADERLRGLAQRLKEEHTDARALDAFRLSELRGLSHPSDRGDVAALGAVAFAISGIVLVIACANVAALLLGRATTRAREIGVRLALGAGRWRIVRQLLTESLLLSLAAGASGLVLAAWTTGALAAWLGVPFALKVEPDRATMLGTIAVSAVAAVLFGLVPALQATRGSLSATLVAVGVAGAGRSRTRLQRASAISQIALSLALLATAGVLIRSIQAETRSAAADEQAGRIISGSLDLAGQGYNTARQRAFMSDLLERLGEVPGVHACSASALGPGQGMMYSAVSVEGHAADASRPSLEQVSWTLPDYFRTMGMPLVRGRDLGREDVAGAAPVVVVNEAFARKYWPGQDPLGKALWLGARDQEPRTVVGVVRTASLEGESQRPQLFVPRLQLPEDRLPWSVAARTSGPAASLAPTFRELVLQLDPALPLFDLATLRQARDQALAPKRAASGVLNIFGGLALLLASIGVYGVIGWQLARRRREIGVRMALGATAGDVLRMAVRDGGRLAAAGVAIGLALALAATRLMSGLVSGASASDTPMLFAVSAAVALVVCAASYLPARRATRVDPAEVLRAE